MSLNEYTKAPLNPRMEIPYLRELMKAANQAIDGKLNSTGQFTCTINVATTVVKNTFCNENSVILPVAVTAAAGVEVGAGGFYIVAGDGQFTVTHANSATAGRTFRYVIIG